MSESLSLPEHPDLYKSMKLQDEVAVAIDDASEFIKMNNLDVEALKSALPEMMLGKDEGISLW